MSDDTEPKSENLIILADFSNAPKKGSGRHTRGEFAKMQDSLSVRRLKNVIDKAKEAKNPEKYMNEHGVVELDPHLEHWCRLLIAGYTGAHAWRMAIEPVTGEPLKSWNVEGLTRTRPIQLRLAQLREEKIAKAAEEGERLKALVRTRLEEEALGGPPANRMRALEMIAKLPEVAASEERVRHLGKDSTSDEVKDAILEKLKRLGSGLA